MSKRRRSHSNGWRCPKCKTANHKTHKFPAGAVKICYECGWTS